MKKSVLFLDYENKQPIKFYATHPKRKPYRSFRFLLFLSIMSTWLIGFLTYILKQDTFLFFYPIVFLVSMVVIFCLINSNEISHNTSISFNESYRQTFERNVIYNEPLFIAIMTEISAFLTDENKETISTNVISKNFSKDDFILMYNAVISLKKSSYAFLQPTNNELNFFDQ